VCETVGRAGTTVKQGIIHSLKAINEIEAGIVTLVRNTVADTFNATGSVANEAVVVTRDMIKGIVGAAEEVGTGLIISTKSVAKAL